MIKILKESRNDVSVIDAMEEEIKEALGTEGMLEAVLSALDYDTKADIYDYIKRMYDLAKVEAAVSGMNALKENWQDNWTEPTIDPTPIDNINGLDIYKGTDQYGDEAYYLFLEDDEYPEPGYEEWQTETLELAREWASSYEDPNDDDFYYDESCKSKSAVSESADSDSNIYTFKALDKGYWDDDWDDIQKYDGKLCRVTDTPVVGPDFKSFYYDIEFEDGTELSAISGIHLYPVKNITFERKVEGVTKQFVKKGSIIHNAGETLEVLDQNSDDTFLVGLDDDGNRKDRYIIAWGLQPDGSWNQGHYFFDEKEARKYFDKRAKKYESASILEDNQVSRNLPYMLDNFLQDVAQIAGTITYSDIMNFKYTEKDKAPLNKLKRAWYDATDEESDDEVLQDIGRKVADYIRK